MYKYKFVPNNPFMSMKYQMLMLHTTLNQTISILHIIWRFLAISLLISMTESYLFIWPLQWGHFCVWSVQNI